MKIDINALLHGSTQAPPGKTHSATGAFQQILAGLSDELAALPESWLALEVLDVLPSQQQALLSPEPEQDTAQESKPPEAAGLLMEPEQVPTPGAVYPQWQLQQMVTDCAGQPDSEKQGQVAIAGHDSGASKPVALSADKALISLPTSTATLNANSKPEALIPQSVEAQLPANALTESAPNNAERAGAPPAALVPIRLPDSAPLSAPVTMPAAATHTNPHPVGSPAWQHSLGQQLTIFTREGVQNAEIRLHPEELGALQISVRMQQDRAQLHIVSEHVLVRQALEAAIPQLRTALAESGVQLGQTQVSAETAHFSGAGYRDPSQGAAGQSEHEDAALPAEEEAERTVVTPLLTPASGINTFA